MQWCLFCKQNDNEPEWRGIHGDNFLDQGVVDEAALRKEASLQRFNCNQERIGSLHCSLRLRKRKIDTKWGNRKTKWKTKKEKEEEEEEEKDEEKEEEKKAKKKKRSRRGGEIERAKKKGRTKLKNKNIDKHTTHELKLHLEILCSCHNERFDLRFRDVHGVEKMFDGCQIVKIFTEKRSRNFL